jgi:hypothetical protein
MFNNVKLISIHALSDLVIFVSYVSIGASLYVLYKVFRGLSLPWKGFLWMFAGFISLCAITHLISVLNIWVTFYWIDGLFKMLTAIFSAAVALTLRQDFSKIKEMKGDFKVMAEKLSSIILEAEAKYQKITQSQDNDMVRDSRSNSKQ